jgi:integrase/recombinase XerD
LSQRASSPRQKTKHLVINQQPEQLQQQYQINLNDPLLDRKIEDVTSGLLPYYSNVLFKVSSSNKENTLTIISYINAMRTEVNLSDNYRKDLILLLSTFSTYFENKLLFKQITRDNLIAFLDSFRKPENVDPLHKWIGTYNINRTHLLRFFKWLYSPEIEPAKRPKPPIIDNIAQLKRKEISIYKPTDLWTEQDDALFLKYCPSKRIKCYHAVSRDTSCRPHEILKLKIRDIVFKTAAGNNNYQYAEVLVNGKTGSRHIPLINSIPYVKDYLDHEHPMSTNPNSIFICGTGKSLGKSLRRSSLYTIYARYRQEYFPKLLESPNVLPEDKQKIRELLQKPWNPYVFRHSALTQKSTMLKEHVLRQHAGWSGRSQMHLKYLHYFGNESSESLLEAYGIIPKDQQSVAVLRPKQCPNCSEPNKPDSRFCAKCRMVLTYDAYNETIEEKQKSNDDLKVLKEQVQSILSILASSDQSDKNEMVKQLIEKGVYKKPS